MSADLREKIARALYDCEKRRADHTDGMLGLSASTMEPWDECKDTFLSDAAAILALLPPGQDESARGALAQELISSIDCILRKPPEPVSHPNQAWCDSYADWHSSYTVARRKVIDRDLDAILAEAPHANTAKSEADVTPIPPQAPSMGEVDRTALIARLKELIDGFSMRRDGGYLVSLLSDAVSALSAPASGETVRVPREVITRAIHALRQFRSLNEWGDPCRHGAIDAVADHLEAALSPSPTTKTEG